MNHERFNLVLPPAHQDMLDALSEMLVKHRAGTDANLAAHMMILLAIRTLYKQMFPIECRQEVNLNNFGIEDEFALISVCCPSKPVEQPQPVRHASSKAIGGNT